MNKWRESMSEIKFESKEKVLIEMMRIEKKNPSVWDKIRRFLNKEVEVPVAAAVSACVIVLMLGTSVINMNKEMTYAYSITVIDEWGQYETY